MALTQLVVEVPGGLIKSADWNGEFSNIYNNPITLISPTTGAINFNLQGHTNLVPTAITATSASNNQVLTVVAGSPAWATPTPAVLTTVATSTGAIFTVSSSGGIVVIPLGTSGQILTVTATGVPASFQTASASTASGTGSLFLTHANVPLGPITTSSQFTLLSTTVPANTLTSNKSLRIVVFSCGNNNAGGQLFAYTFTFGGTTILSSSNMAFQTNANHQQKLEFWITQQGSSAQQVNFLTMVDGVSNTSQTGTYIVRTTSNIDATASQTLNLFANWTGAGAGQSATIESVTVESV